MNIKNAVKSKEVKPRQAFTLLANCYISPACQKTQHCPQMYEAICSNTVKTDGLGVMVPFSVLGPLPNPLGNTTM